MSMEQAITPTKSAGESKIEELTARIQGGEKADSVLQGLPESWANEIKENLNITQKVLSDQEQDAKYFTESAGKLKINELADRADARIKAGENHDDVLNDITEGLPKSWVKEIIATLNHISTSSNFNFSNHETVNTIESPLQSKNLFDSEKAKQIIEVTKKWTKYGGHFYDHMTGKSINLEKGIDYKADPNGVPDMVSYREATQKKIDTWLTDQGNQMWFSAGEKFKKNNNVKNMVKEVVRLQQPDGTFIEKERVTAPFFNEAGWLYYESNYFDSSVGKMTQPEREDTKFRVYFSCDGADVISTYQEVITELNNDPDLRKLGFQMKTAEIEAPPSEIDSHGEKKDKREYESDVAQYKMKIGQMMNQKDRIVLYLGEEGIKKALPILQKYAEKNRNKFNSGGVLLSQPLTDSDGNEISGISITSETKGKSPDQTESSTQLEYKSFSDMQSKVIMSSYRSLVANLQNPDVLQSLGIKYPTMKDSLVKLPPSASVEDYIRVILVSPEGEQFLEKNLQVLYVAWSKSFGMSENNIAFKAQQV